MQKQFMYHKYVLIKFYFQLEKILNLLLDIEFYPKQIDLLNQVSRHFYNYLILQ